MFESCSLVLNLVHCLCHLQLFICKEMTLFASMCYCWPTAWDALVFCRSSLAFIPWCWWYLCKLFLCCTSFWLIPYFEIEILHSYLFYLILRAFLRLKCYFIAIVKTLVTIMFRHFLDSFKWRCYLMTNCKVLLKVFALFSTTTN